MKVQPGGVYVVELQLTGAEHLGPTWLVGAFARTFPQVDVVQVERYESGLATVRIRWRGAHPDEIPAGATITGGMEGLAVPGQAIPVGTVVSVKDTGQVARTLEQSLPDSIKLVIAGGLLVTTWYFANKIKESHAQPSAAGA